MRDEIDGKPLIDIGGVVQVHHGGDVYVREDDAAELVRLLWSGLTDAQRREIAKLGGP